jgi:hypothetical protein
MSKLRFAIEVAAKSRNREHWESIPVSVISKELAAKIGRVIRPNIQEELTFKNALRTLDCGDFRDLLIEVETFLRKVGTDRLSWRISEWESKSGRNEPVIFYQRIQFLWTECFGRELKYSRNARTNQIGGPLVRYFLTVTEPIMGDKAPSAESIPDILKRQKKFRDWYLDPEREFELEAAKQGWARGTLILSSWAQNTIEYSSIFFKIPSMRARVLLPDSNGEVLWSFGAKPPYFDVLLYRRTLKIEALRDSTNAKMQTYKAPYQMVTVHSRTACATIRRIRGQQKKSAKSMGNGTGASQNFQCERSNAVEMET